MDRSVRRIVESYRADLPLEEAVGLPAAWYTDPAVFNLERRAVFGRSWQVVGRLDQLREPGFYVTAEIAGEPVLLARGHDGLLRGFFNVCRHKGAAILTEAEGSTAVLRCPYHGWTYTLEGKLRGTPDFAGVRQFSHAASGLVEIETLTWEAWALARLDRRAGGSFPPVGLSAQARQMDLQGLHWQERRAYSVDCNWKVFIENYLDGGYHVPHLHGKLDAVLDYRNYAIETGEGFCLQSSPIVAGRADAEVASVRRGDRALYIWIHPNFMINWYDGVMDTNLVKPIAPDRSEVIFDFYFEDIAPGARQRNLASIALSERIQEEDAAICRSVQRGIESRAYAPGRLSPRREKGEHLFHRLLYNNLVAALEDTPEEGM
ncbi:MAG TPA: aromatic ring-hydroxylating dioxygenase subunit alpha [Candidatus Eisenbacteria bacterium]|nr:aromatic ring-hydroxylating dioxygenase subunit alpha [Candidatus Eisenbacteria bacterium]